MTNGSFIITILFSQLCLASFYLAIELSLLLGPVQNKNLPSRGDYCEQHLQHSVSLSLGKEENTLDIALDTLQSLVLISPVKYCVTQTLQILHISKDPQTRVAVFYSLIWKTVLLKCI